MKDRMVIFIAHALLQKNSHCLLCKDDSLYLCNEHDPIGQRI